MSKLNESQQALLAQLDAAKKLVKADAYDMVIGELVSLYKDDEIKLKRAPSWNEEQKTKLVESILLGIPISEIFVSQENDGSWTVVNGVQRLSTIFQLVGILDGKDSLKLTSCKYLDALKGKTWADFPIALQRRFKTSKVRVNIILMKGTDEEQYELSQRLNTHSTN